MRKTCCIIQGRHDYFKIHIGILILPFFPFWDFSLLHIWKLCLYQTFSFVVSCHCLLSYFSWVSENSLRIVQLKFCVEYSHFVVFPVCFEERGEMKRGSWNSQLLELKCVPPPNYSHIYLYFLFLKIFLPGYTSHKIWAGNWNISAAFLEI